MKRALSTLLALAILLSLVAGCAPKEPAPAQAPPASSNTEKDTAASKPLTLAEKLKVDPNIKQTITVMSWNHTEQRRELVNQTIELFNKKYPNITIEHSPVEDYNKAYKLAFDSGEPPDITYLDDTNQNLLERYDYLRDITEIAKEMRWAEKSKPGAIEYNNRRHPDKIFSVPHVSGPRVVWYNKKIFNELGLSEPVTIDEYNELLAKIKSAGYTPFEASIRTFLWHIDGLLFGTVPIEDITKWYYLEETTEAFKAGRLAALKQVEDWIKKGYYRKDITAVDHNNLNVLFGRGDTVLYVSGASAAKPLNTAGLDVGAFPYPKKSKDFQTTLVDAADSGWAISAAMPEEKLAAAVAFIDTFFTPESAKQWAEGGFVTTMNFDISDAKIFPQQMAAMKATEGAQMGYFLDNAVPGLLDAMEILNAKILLGEITGEQYAETIASDYEKLKEEELAKR
jgi:raffinose/stachyose/melibiose transport system substrate-binding protein